GLRSHRDRGKRRGRGVGMTNPTDQLKIIVRRLVTRVKLMVGRCVLLAVNDTLNLQKVQVHALNGEILDGVERIQDYGFTSVPLAGAEGVVIAVGGNRSHALALSIFDRRNRLKDLQPGEVAIYSHENADSETGHRIVLKNGREIEIYGDKMTVITDTSVEVVAPTVTVNAESVQVNAESVEVDTDTIEVTAATKCTLNCGDLNLGGEGGEKVARIGDRVQIDTGDSAGLWPIVEGSDHARAL
ncbi:MAG: phage baseplate assembly protein V, partial [Rhodospirillales bacterium]